MSSALPPRTDIGLAPQNITRIEWNKLAAKSVRAIHTAAMRAAPAGGAASSNSMRASRL
jgi:hypothetical protein